jgi:hypothetical protein
VVVYRMAENGFTRMPVVGRAKRKFLDPLSFPHLHAVHPLSAALQRMGTHLDVLPVVSRADIHKMEGVVMLNDVLDSYGWGPAAWD